MTPALPDADPVKVTLQLEVGPVPDMRVQLVTLKLPVIPVCVNETVPDGIVGATLDVSVTVALQVDGCPTNTGLVQDTVVVVGCWPGVRTTKPELVKWVESPGYVAVTLW